MSQLQTKSDLALRQLVLLFAFMGVLYAEGPGWAAETPNRPNIVFILADDLGFGDPQCYRADSKIPTPNIDRLAREGMRFTDAHTPTAVCSPTRYALLTGRYAWRTRLTRGVLGPYCAPLVERERLTLPDMLKQHNYSTACIGKWHLGMQWGTKNPNTKLPPLWDHKFDQSKIDLSKPITAGPLSAGFDSYFGTAVPNFPPYCFIENDHVLGKIPDAPKPDNMYGDSGLMQEGWDLHRILPSLRNRAVEFIQQRAASNKPFFLYLPLTAPHTPIVPNKEYAGKSEAGDYGDLVAEVDGVVGAVTEALKQNGVAENTLVIFTSDNGSPARAGDPHLRGRSWADAGAVERMFGHNPNAPWRGMKADIFEGGHRVPFIVRWPGSVQPGTTNRQLVCLVDWMATVAAIVGHDLPLSAAEDSFDLLPTLREATKSVRDDLIHHSANGILALRQGDWKLILGKGSGGWTRVKIRDEDPAGQLYNLAVDPDEANNLYDQRPKIVSRLTNLLNKYKTAGRSRPVH
jgi:arylsulfatase A-like enzyme